MARKLIVFNPTDFIMMAPAGKGFMRMEVTKDQLRSITIEPCTNKILGLIPSKGERICIELRSRPDPVIFTDKISGKFFAEYKEEFRKFAANNRVTLNDKTV